MSADAKNGVGIRALAVMFIAACAIAAVFLGFRAYLAFTANPVVTSVYNEEGVVPAAGEAGVDFGALASQNADVCAWITEPDMGINAPVVQSQAKKSFYKSHDAMGVKSADGAVFINAYNAADMTDAVTVLNVSEASNLGQALLGYGNASVFEAAQPLRLYTPGYVRTYQLVAAYRDDDRDVLEKHNYFSSYSDLEQFEAELLNLSAVGSNVAQGASLDLSSKLLVLSTYQTEALASGHFIVCGVLTDESAV